MQSRNQNIVNANVCYSLVLIYTGGGKRKKRKEMKILNISVNTMKVIRLKSFSSSTGLTHTRLFSLNVSTDASRRVLMSTRTDWFILCLLEKALIVKTNCKYMVVVSGLKASPIRIHSHQSIGPLGSVNPAVRRHSVSASRPRPP